MIDLCHLYGVRTNLAFNVVIFEHEFPKVIELLEKILPMGPDAFIVQDLGLASLIRKMAPHQRIHASTQMTVTNPDAIKLLDDLKIDRFVLGRENSLPEIQLIREQTDKELEVFVHGALCVAYSGQCFTSESIGGRSANRGQCAQSCRLEYELYVDDVKKDLGDKKYLVSPKDLMGIEEVPALKAVGVNSFKIEGRLKTPEYVAATARNYREVLDGGELKLSQRTRELASTYSRGFFTGWLKGVDHQNLVDATYSAHRGLAVGTIREVRKKTIILDSSTELKAGQGLLFVGKEEIGAKIFQVGRSGGSWEVELLQKNLLLIKGMQVYLNSDETLDRELQKGWQSREFQKRIPLNFSVVARVDQPLKLTAIDPEGRIIEVESKTSLSKALNRALTKEIMAEELCALGASVYEIQNFQLDMDGELFLHQRELKELRRELVEKMNEARIQRQLPSTNKVSLTQITKQKASHTALNVLLRTKVQVDGFAEAFRRKDFASFEHLLNLVILDFEFGKDYAESVALIRELGLKSAIATTRILKPKEYHHLKTIIRCRPDMILVRNLGALHFLKQETEIPLIGDFSLNVTNSQTADYLIAKGLETVNTSYDLNQEQLLDLLKNSDPAKTEVTLHQYMPEFHMEHCVFAAFLSKGHSFRDCGKPCERHEVKLKDPYGNWHHLKADQECRNTFFKATPQSASFLLETLKEQGVHSVRLEALNESPQELNHKIQVYLKLLAGSISAQSALDELKLMETYGLGAGQLNKADTYKDRKKTL